jgi:hypothetical protein
MLEHQSVESGQYFAKMALCVEAICNVRLTDTIALDKYADLLGIFLEFAAILSVLQPIGDVIY